MNIDWNALGQELVSLAASIGGKLIAAILVLVIGRVIVKAFMKAVRKSKFISKAEVTVSHFLINILSISLNILLVVSVIGILGVPMSSVIAVIASAGVAVGLALQGSLSNLAGGVMILIFKPFRIGDYIDAGSHAGTVADIGIFYTVLTTPDNKEVTIPNGTIMGSPIENYSTHDTRRVDFTFQVAYGTDVELVKKLLLEEANGHDLVLKDPSPFARLSSQGSSSIDFTLRAWAKNSDYWTVKFDLLERIHARFAAAGIEIPFNQLDVHIANPL